MLEPQKQEIHKMTVPQDTYKLKKAAADRRSNHKAAKGIEECHSLAFFNDTEQIKIPTTTRPKK